MTIAPDNSSSAVSAIPDCCSRYALSPIISKLYTVFRESSGSERNFDAINAAGIDAKAKVNAVLESISPLLIYPMTPLLNPKDSTKMAIPAVPFKLKGINA